MGMTRRQGDSRSEKVIADSNLIFLARVSAVESHGDSKQRQFAEKLHAYMPRPDAPNSRVEVGERLGSI